MSVSSFVLRPVAAAVVLTGLYAGIGYWGVPAAVRFGIDTYLPEAVGGRDSSVESVTFNPWTWTLDIEGLRVGSANNPKANLLTLKSLSADISSQSLVKMAPVVEALAIDSLAANVTTNDPNKEEAKEKASDTKSAASSIPAFSLSNLSVKNSSLHFTNAKAGAEVAIDDIALSLPVISTLEGTGELSVKPQLSMKIDGRPVTAKGSIEGDSASLTASVTSLDAAKLILALPVDLPVALKSGILDATVKADFDAANAGTTLRLSGSTTVRRLDVRELSGQKIASADSASVSLVSLDLAGKTIDISSVALAGGNIYAERTPPSKSSGKASSASTSSSSNSDWNWNVRKVSVSGTALHVTDSTLKPAATLNVTGIGVTASNLTSDAKAPDAPFSLTAGVAGGTVAAKGKVNIPKMTAQTTTDITNLSLATFSPWVASLAGASFKAGTLSVKGSANVASAAAKSTWKGSLDLKNIKAVSAEGKTLMSWSAATATDVNVRSVDPISLTVGKLIVKEPAQKVTKTTGKLLNVFGAIAAMTGHETTAKRLDKAEDAITKDITASNLVYNDGKFSVSGKGTDSLQGIALQTLNSVFAKKN